MLFGLLYWNTQSVLAQTPYWPYMFQAYDLDTAQLEWSAMGASTSYLVVSTVEQPDSLQIMNSNTGDIRLRWYFSGIQGHNDPVFDTSFYFPGHARVTQITPVSNNGFYISGGFTDTLFVGQDTLINPEAGFFDPFIIKMNRNGILWHWSAHHPQQHGTINKIRLNNSSVINRVLVVGQESDTSSFMMSMDEITGNQLWKEVVPGSFKLTDIYFNNNLNTQDLLVTGICSTGAKPFGHLLPTQPVTTYQSFLYKRNLHNNTEMFLAAVSHNMSELAPEIMENQFLSVFSFNWATPVYDTSDGLLLRKYRYYDQGAYYANQEELITRTTGPVFHSKVGYKTDFLAGFLYVSLIKKAGNGLNNIELESYGSRSNVNFDLGHPTVAPWFASYQNGRLWLATTFKSSLNYAYPGTSGITLNFSTIHASQVRWAVIRSMPLVSVPTIKNTLSFQIFPNPVYGRQLSIRLSDENPGNTNWTLRDLQGKTLLEGNFSVIESTLDLKELQSGIYLIELSRANQKVVRKVVLP